MFWFIKRRYESISIINSLKNDFSFWNINKRKIIPIIVTFFLIFLSLILFYPRYWDYEFSTKNSQVQTGITNKGYPWIGAINPELTIIEFADYRCFQCKKIHFSLRQLVNKFPDKLRIVHRHYPMDHRYNPIVKEPFHSGAGILSLIAIAAGEQNLFWEANDYLYNYDMSENVINLSKIAKDLNIDLTILQNSINDKTNVSKLSSDILFGIKQKIAGTPAYIINNKVYIGQIPPEFLEALF